MSCVKALRVASVTHIMGQKYNDFLAELKAKYQEGDNSDIWEMVRGLRMRNVVVPSNPLSRAGFMTAHSCAQSWVSFKKVGVGKASVTLAEHPYARIRKADIPSGLIKCVMLLSSSPVPPPFLGAAKSKHARPCIWSNHTGQRVPPVAAITFLPACPRAGPSNRLSEVYPRVGRGQACFRQPRYHLKRCRSR